MSFFSLPQNDICFILLLLLLLHLFFSTLPLFQFFYSPINICNLVSIKGNHGGFVNVIVPLSLACNQENLRNIVNCGRGSENRGNRGGGKFVIRGQCRGNKNRGRNNFVLLKHSTHQLCRAFL